MSKNTSGNTAACDHPRPRAGVDTLLALGIGGFVTGPTGPGTWQPSWSSTPSLGAWPCLRGASAPALPVHQGAQCDVLWCFSGPKSEPAGVGLMVSRSPCQGWARVLQPNLRPCFICTIFLAEGSRRHSADPWYGFSILVTSPCVPLSYNRVGEHVCVLHSDTSCLQSYLHVCPPTSVVSS